MQIVPDHSSEKTAACFGSKQGSSSLGFGAESVFEANTGKCIFTGTGSVLLLVFPFLSSVLIWFNVCSCTNCDLLKGYASLFLIGQNEYLRQPMECIMRCSFSYVARLVNSTKVCDHRWTEIQSCY